MNWFPVILQSSPITCKNMYVIINLRIQTILMGFRHLKFSFLDLKLYYLLASESLSKFALKFFWHEPNWIWQSPGYSVWPDVEACDQLFC